MAHETHRRGLTTDRPAYATTHLSGPNAIEAPTRKKSIGQGPDRQNYEGSRCPSSVRRHCPSGERNECNPRTLGFDGEVFSNALVYPHTEDDLGTTPARSRRQCRGATVAIALRSSINTECLRVGLTDRSEDDPTHKEKQDSGHRRRDGSNNEWSRNRDHANHADRHAFAIRPHERLPKTSAQRSLHFLRYDVHDLCLKRDCRRNVAVDV